MPTVFSDNYTGHLPLIDIDLFVDNTGDKASIKALLDTGCSGGIVLTKKEIEKLGVTLGDPVNEKPVPCKIADGSSVPTYYYNATVKFKGEKKSVLLRVINQDEVYEKKEEKDEPVMALFGLDIMNDYQVTFNGLSHPRSYLFGK